VLIRSRAGQPEVEYFKVRNKGLELIAVTLPV